MIEITLRELARIIGGTLIGNGDASVTSTVETDSRLVSSGSLFFAKPGEIADGHDFVSDAIKNGAVAAVVERQLPDQINQIAVEDSVKALGLLAAWLVSELRSLGNIQVVGITGSNGKTTTKNMLREILSKLGPTTAPIESFNNHVGAPISILRADAQTQFLIVEMGAKGLGSIDYLAKIAKPDVGVILKVGLAHVGEFGGIEKTAAIKGELADAMQPSGRLVLNCDDSLVRKMKESSKAPVVWFGTDAEANYRAEDITLTKDGTSFTMCWPDGQKETISLKIIGDFHIMNALAAAAAAELLGASKKQILDGLQAMELAERWRMQRMVRSDGVTIINDAYNASPDSMKAALQTLAQLGQLGSRTVAVLGHMAELGDLSVSEHDAIGRLAVRLNISQLVVVGDEAKLIHMAASQEGSWAGESLFFSTIDEAFEYLRGILSQGDTVLVKSSKSANLRFLGDRLMEAV
jgi:UDP-N-acetylmuramoyl-tripeptide--D-alanyl-D-alanine ligase